MGQCVQSPSLEHEQQDGQTYGEDPPTRLKLVEDAARLVRVYGVEGLAARETPAELDHALGEADLAQALIALGLGESGNGLAAGAMAATVGLCID